MNSIAIFVYNRPQHTLNLLKSLEKCQNIKKSKIYIFSDGCNRKKNGDFFKVKYVREIISNYALKKKNTLIIYRRKNYGLFNNLIKGISQVLQLEKATIVLEDDLILHRGFIKFMNSALKKYKNSSKVLQISGYSYPIKTHNKKSYFLTLTSCWGWAITQKKWKEFINFLKDKKKIKLLANDILSSKLNTYEFNYSGSFNYSSFLKKQLKKQFNSWGILFYLFAFYKGYLTLFPNFSLVTNNGFDGSGAHKSINSIFKFKVRNKNISYLFPKNIESNSINSLKIKNFFKDKFNLKNKIFSYICATNIFKKNETKDNF